MASIPGSVRVGGFIAPSDTTDTYATHDSLYGRGGLKEVSSTEERDAIPADRRREGMVVYVGGVVQANYQLIGGIDNANWAVLEAGGGGGVTDHGALTGLADDDHTQYLNETRHDLLDHTGLTGIPSITGLLDETAHDLLDHTGLTGIPTQYTDEMAQDAIGTLITNGTQSGITVSYDDVNNKLDFTVTASGGGDVIGPSSATDGNIVLFDGVTGKVIKDSTYNPSSFAAALGADDNYVTDAEKAALHSHSNKTALDSVSGINTGDQDLSGYSLTTHNHAGVYEPADATILKDADIGVTVQAYDADLTSWAAIAPSAKQDTLISGTNIKTINNTSLLGSGNIAVEGGGTSIPVQETAPESPEEGDLWVDSDATVTQASIPVNWTSPTVITDTANLTYGSYNIVSVTAADKILTLPEITSSDYGKFVVVEIAASTTKLITIDGYSTQTIDGATTRIMWASEVAQLVATASGWTKVGGKSVPMLARMSIATTDSVSIANQTTVKVLLDKNVLDSAGMVSTANNRINIRRPGIYSTSGAAIFQSLTTSTLFELDVWVNGVLATAFAIYGTGSAQSYPSALTPVANISLASGDYLELYIYHTSGAARNLYTESTGYFTYLAVTEVLTW